MGEFVKEILGQVDQFKEHSHQTAHLKKITEAENKAIEAQHAAEELRIRLAEKEGVLKAMTDQMAEQQAAIESLNIQITDIKDEMTLAANAQTHDHQHFVETLKTQQAEELNRLLERIREVEAESASLKEEAGDHKSRVAELEAQLLQTAKGRFIRHRRQNGLRRTPNPVPGAVQDLRGGQKPTPARKTGR